MESPETKPSTICLKYGHLSVTDHSLATKPDGKTQGPQVGKTTTASAKAIKATKKDDAVDRETLQLVEAQLQHVTKGFDAVSVLFQYLVDDVSTIIITLSLRSVYMITTNRIGSVVVVERSPPTTSFRRPDSEP